MKYGIIMHKETANLGDDIQSYAAAKLLPQVDYVIDREHLDSFTSEDNEPVAVIMAAWWFWQKWNWPPAECIMPLLISMHINNYTIYNRGTPIQDQWLQGVGGEYLKAYGPVGVRDQSSLEFFREKGIDTYFSGCITLTLPKQKKTEDAGSYVCLVDLNPALKKKAMELLEGTGLRVVELTHKCHYRGVDADLDTRFEEVEKYLTLYQNARCVITRRLHVSLPCLAMKVPVLSVVDLTVEDNFTRWSPYAEWLHYVSNEDFLTGNFTYDFCNPPENKPIYKETRQALLDRIQRFIADTSAMTGSVYELRKTSYTHQEVLNWQHHLMKWTLEEWLHQSRGMMAKYNKSVAENKKLKAENKELKKQLEDNLVIRILKKIIRKIRKMLK